MPQTTINDLPLLPQQLIGQDFYTYVTTPTGGDFIAKLGEIVAQMQAVQGGTLLRTFGQLYDPTQVTAAVSVAPINLGIVPSGQSIVIMSAYAGLTGDLTTPYGSNTTIGIRYLGADEPIFTLDLLGRTAGGIVPMIPNTAPAIGNTVEVANSGLEWYVIGGAATGGTADLNVSLSYILI
jgi:hypothetical protein